MAPMARTEAGMVEFEEIWERIRQCEGQTFQKVRGGTFTYRMTNSALIPDTTPRNIPRKDVLEAFGYVPLRNTVEVQHLQGPSYLFAVLMDERIRRSDW
jgi:hypothetical protein